jgi:hypothetical protein
MGEIARPWEECWGKHRLGLGVLGIGGIDADWIDSQRNLPAKGFRPGVLLLGMGAIMGYGWYKLIVGIREAKYVRPTPSIFPNDRCRFARKRVGMR